MTGLDNDTPVRNRWYGLGGLDSIKLVPAFLLDRLRHLPEHTEHIVHRDAGFPASPDGT